MLSRGLLSCIEIPRPCQRESFISPQGEIKDFHGCEINQLSLESKCNRLCFEENTECVSCHFCRADKEGVGVCEGVLHWWNSCPLNTFPTKPLQLDGSMGIMDPLEQQWLTIKKYSHFFLFNLNWIFCCWMESINGSRDNIQSTERLHGKLLFKFIVETLPPSGKTLHLLSACQPLWNGPCILIH